MADIFISYSKSDIDLTRGLAAYLESEGWSVWWDSNLRSGDEFRAIIEREIDSALAVITIWTSSSVASPWVRAETNRAASLGKLIVTKVPPLNYREIPIPFGELHTENVHEYARIKDAVTRLLSTRAIELTPRWTITKMVRPQILTWVGIVGGCITLFTSLRGLTSLAAWAHWLVTRWREWMDAFWTILNVFGIHVPHALAPTLSFLSFTAVLVVGVRVHAVNRNEHEHLPPPAKALRNGAVGIIAFVGMPILLFYLVSLVSPSVVETFHLAGMSLLLAFGWLIAFPTGYVMVFTEESEQRFRLWSGAIYMAFALFLVVVPLFGDSLEGPDLPDPDEEAAARVTLLFMLAIYFLVFQIFMMVAILITPSRRLAERLAFLAIGLLILIFLNEISKIDMESYFYVPAK